MGRNTKEIELFGRKLILSERSASDVLELAEFINKNSGDQLLNLYVAVFTVYASLKCNYDNINWYSFQKKKLKKILSSDNLMKLSTKELIDLMYKVYELEGIKVDTNTTADSEKKK